MITVEDVRRRVEKLKAMTGDPEAFHAEEDALHLEVLSAIAEGHPAPAELAAEAIATAAIDCERWCA